MERETDLLLFSKVKETKIKRGWRDGDNRLISHHSCLLLGFGICLIANCKLEIAFHVSPSDMYAYDTIQCKPSPVSMYLYSAEICNLHEHNNE
jgi:hypothetical protein